MSQNPNQSQAELMSLLNAFVSEAISDDEMTRLELLLRGRPEAQDELLAFSQLHIDLMVELGADRATKAFCERQAQFATVVAPILLPDSEPDRLVPVDPPHLFGFPGWTMLGGLALGAMLVLAGVIWFGALRNDDLIPELPFAQAPVAIDSPKAPVVTSMQLGEDYAEIGLEKIGRVKIGYPADFRLIGPMRARLNYGQIKVVVTEETGRGFVVETPDGEVTDLGTEFGLDVREGHKTGLVVLDGQVDLRVATTHKKNPEPSLERLVKGDGVLFKKDDAIDRIMAVFSDERGMYRTASAFPDSLSGPLIAQVEDNLPPSETKRYYEIVPGGMREDALCYVDRLEHNWNGVDQWGMPSYLVGADYIKTFNDDKHRKGFNIRLLLARPAKVYVFLDDRVEPPEWLKKSFRNTGDTLGIDAGARFSLKEKESGKPHHQTGTGPGASIDGKYMIWERIVDKPGPVVLGVNGVPKNLKRSYWASMYGIAVAELDDGREAQNTN